MDNKLILSILKLRKNLHDLYKKHNRLTLLVIKGLAALLTFLSINSLYQNQDTRMIILAAGLALTCALVPMRFIFVAGALINALHLWQVSWDLSLCYMAIVFIAWVFICRIHPDCGIIIGFTPLLFGIKMPFLLSILVGLFASVFGVGAMVFGMLFYFIGASCANVGALLSSASGGTNLLAIQSVMAGFSNDKEYILLMGACVIAALITYIVCHQSFDYAWYIGCVAGGLAGLIVYLAGSILFEIKLTNMIYMFTIPVAMLIGCVVQFIRCIIDYSSAEYAEFEDDNYYYYVKAVPKVNVIVDDFAMMDELKTKTISEEEIIQTEEQE